MLFVSACLSIFERNNRKEEKKGKSPGSFVGRCGGVPLDWASAMLGSMQRPTGLFRPLPSAGDEELGCVSVFILFFFLFIKALFEF